MVDEELVRQALAGKSSAYDQLVRLWARRITAFCHARVRRIDIADELAQETLVRGYVALPTLSDPRRFGSWLCGIALRVCLDWLKRSERSEVSLNDDDPADLSDEDSPGAAMDTLEEKGRLLAEVERLPLKLREVIMLYYYQDTTYQELADLLGVSFATINARLTQARALLRERLSALREL